MANLCKFEKQLSQEDDEDCAIVIGPCFVVTYNK